MIVQIRVFRLIVECDHRLMQYVSDLRSMIENEGAAMSLTGGCRCGAVRYELSLDAVPLTYACHCRDCQTWSGSAFALHAMLPETLLTIEGEIHRFQLNGMETMHSEHAACAACSTRIANHNTAVAGMVILRAGTLDRSDELSPAVHIWTSRKQQWLIIPEGTPSFAETPSQQEFAAAIMGSS
jgi:hypothetical protein